MQSKYDPSLVEAKWYKYWEENKLFRSVPDGREAYTIVIPPPNVTGILHMGHMLNNTIQDILIRRARMKGYNACWVPGTDHASIATEAKVVKQLREEKGIKKSELSREEFMKHAWAWTEKYGGIIISQLKKLGCSCDWERERFTLEPQLSEAVAKVFVDLYRKGKIYRGLRMTNWDPAARTVLSNEEVEHVIKKSKLYHLRYQIEGSEDEWVVIATTRPETILGDTAVAVHPNDPRYEGLQGKRAIVPIAGRSIPIIFDTYVDCEFGTGALKVTPAHDTNDHEIGQRHNLEVIDIFNEDGSLSEAAGFYIGKDRFEVRKLIAKDLEAAGHLVKVEDYTNKIGLSERTQAVVEPRLTMQWFLDMKELAATALKAVESGEVKFFPPHFFNMYNNWLREDNIRDWCISRQLWWGHRVPAWYLGGEVFVAETAGEALEQAREKTGDASLQIGDLKQDKDALDTWFSSWLWPLSVFDGFQNPEELRYYYPTNVLVTGWDIMFFWVARMIMAGYEWSEDLLGRDFVEEHGREPFRHVFYTGMIRDRNRKKMSKSLGNSPDALTLIDKYGADGVRYGVMSCAAAGNDIVFDAPFDPETKKVKNESKLCEQGRNFCNKIWNALRLVKGWEVKEGENGENLPVIAWFEAKLNQTIAQIEGEMESYRISEAVKTLYSFIWNDFFSVYLELVKPPYGEAIDGHTYAQTIAFFEKQMQILHPFMPFLTEEVYQNLQVRPDGDSICTSRYPKAGEMDQLALQKGELAKEVMTKIRDLRNAQGLKQREPLEVFAKAEQSGLYGEFIPVLVNKAYLKSFGFTNEDNMPDTATFRVGTDTFMVKSEQEVDTESERTKLEKELEYNTDFRESVLKKLQNERFVNNAPAKVVELERKKLADAEDKIKLLEESLAKLN